MSAILSATPPAVNLAAVKGKQQAKKEDLAAMVEDIRNLKTRVDVVVVSFHWGLHFIPRAIPMYCLDIGHAAVDAGSDLVLGTHTHILKGIEVYKGKVIFYSTSNFALEAGPGTVKDGDYIKFLAPLTKHYGIHWDPEYPTIVAHPEGKATLIVKALIEDGEIKRVSYLPCYVNRKAEPVIMKHDDLKGPEVFTYVEDISKSEGLPVHFAWEADEVLSSC